MDVVVAVLDAIREIDAVAPCLYGALCSPAAGRPPSASPEEYVLNMPLAGTGTLEEIWVVERVATVLAEACGPPPRVLHYRRLDWDSVVTGIAAALQPGEAGGPFHARLVQELRLYGRQRVQDLMAPEWGGSHTAAEKALLLVHVCAARFRGPAGDQLIDLDAIVYAAAAQYYLLEAFGKTGQTVYVGTELTRLVRVWASRVASWAAWYRDHLNHLLSQQPAAERLASDSSLSDTIEDDSFDDADDGADDDADDGAGEATTAANAGILGCNVLGVGILGHHRDGDEGSVESAGSDGSWHGD